jgi:23S rRNA (adenine1618-N6)-methyltransferase
VHPRSRHQDRYDFPALLRACPALGAFVGPSPAGDLTIDFADPAAVLALNRALLLHHYGIRAWEIPPGYLCPPIPGRVDYVHHVADLLATDSGKIPRGPGVAIIEIGVGANCIYPLLGRAEYGWRFVGTETDPVALQSAQANVAANPALAMAIECRHQPTPTAIFQGVVHPGENFAASMCNPPFHVSAAAAAAGTERKVRNLAGSTAGRPVLNFGGRSHELWCPGGETAFIRRMITESAHRPSLCRWFTTLVSKRESLPLIHSALRAAKATAVRTIDMSQGQKRSRIVAWTFR